MKVQGLVGVKVKASVFRVKGSRFRVEVWNIGSKVYIVGFSV